ncbi:glycosyl hydrolase family 43 protein [Bimuria novae-zelandiae CBS 107.79]|uniref:Glycosyl hydrolase family 43 protein n=1 Tax=Bimuria novae-zelandiae CBS 107.79 TaxID=1447943 RepID=A0A6A5VK57_9PLEO|nr:glycosyl hydrolase family 43 protein [Bimuria novae-zelandiae CBS 107.79]
MRFSTVVSAALLGLVYASPLGVNSVDKRAATFTNPILWEDYPDLEVIRVGDVFYYTSSTFAFSPGAPILKSYDLVNWTPVTHSVPTLNFGSEYSLTNSTNRAYVKGIWASSLRYRESTDTFYWLGCIASSKSYLWTASNTGAKSNNGEVTNWNWKAAATIDKCYYDNGLLIDDDDTIYVAYGSTNIMVAQLNKDGTAEVKSQTVYQGSTYIEGSRMYKINGYYYIFVTKPAIDEWVLKSKSPWGPYEMKVLVENIKGPLDNAGAAHQGGIVSTKDGNWYYIAFLDSFPGGRIPVAAPITWSSDGWPLLVKDSTGAWGKTYPFPVNTTKTVPPPTGVDTFKSTSLSHEWEWNHNPDTSAYKLFGGASGGMQLSTATVTNDLYSARNTLTHRIIGPKSSGTFHLDITSLTDGDRAGAALFRDHSAYIGIHRENTTNRLVYVNNLSIDVVNGWKTNAIGTVAASLTLPSSTKQVWLRVKADITPAFNTATQRTTTFWYSLDGKTWTQLGGAFAMTNDWQFFTGFRYAVFNFATKALGGKVVMKSFEMEKWE